MFSVVVWPFVRDRKGYPNPTDSRADHLDPFARFRRRSEFLCQSLYHRRHIQRLAHLVAFENVVRIPVENILCN